MGSYIETPRGPLHAVDFGGSGETTLLIHGLAGSTTNWQAIAPRLATNSHVVAVDLPGFGLSPPHDDFSLQTHAAAVEGVIATLGHPLTLIGNSTGGLVSEIVASRRPDLVTRMVLISPATPPVFPDDRLDWRTVARLAIEATPLLGEAFIKRMLRGKTPNEVVRFSFENVTDHPGRVPVEVIEASLDLYRQRMAFPWVAKAINRTATSIAMTYARRDAYEDMVRAIVAPTLMIQGVEDRIVSPTAVEALHAIRPDWKLVQMDDTGHVPQMDAPIRTVDVIENWYELAGVRPGSEVSPSN